MNNPIAEPATIPNYFVVKEASKYVKIVLSEEGADELFGKYNIYREPLSLKMFDYISFSETNHSPVRTGFPRRHGRTKFLNP